MHTRRVHELRWTIRVVSLLGALLCVAAVTATSSHAARLRGVVKLGVISTWGTAIADQQDVVGGAQAAARSINKTGGINGEKVQIIPCNYQADTNTDTACASTMVSDKVAAMVGDWDIFNSATGPVFSQAGIPLVGPQATGPFDMTNPDAWLLNGPLIANYGAAYDYAAAKTGQKRMAIFRLDVSGTVAQSGYMQEFAKKYGITVTTIVPVPLSATDLSSYAEQLLATHPNVIALDGPSVVGLALMQAINNLGATNMTYVLGAAIMDGSQAIAKEFAAAAKPKHVVVISGYPVSLYKSISGGSVPQYISDMNAANKAGIAATAPSVRVDDTAMDAWLSVYAVQQLATRKIHGKVTSRNLTAALKDTHRAIPLFNLLNWAPAAHGPIPAAPRAVSGNTFLMTINSRGTFNAINTKPVNVL